MENFKTAKLFDAGGNLSERWFVFYYFRSPDTGKFERFRQWIPAKIRTASGRRDKAHQIISKINRKLREGFNPYSFMEKKYTSISVAMQTMLNVKQDTCRKRTFFTYRSMVKIFLEWLEKKKLEHLPLDDFNYYHAQEFMDQTNSKRKNSNRTYNNRLAAMRTIFNNLVKRDWILVNPFDRVEFLEEEEPEIVSFTVDELELMQKHLPTWNYDLYVCACLVFYCFIRPQEIVRLRVSHMLIRDGWIVIPGTISKNKKNETVQIPDALKPVLNRLDLGFPPEFFVFGKNQKRSKQEYAPTRIAEAWRKFADHYGITKSLYSLKHTGVGMAIEAGINLRDLQIQLRHSSLEMTQIYLDKFKRRPSEKLATNFPDLARLAKKNELSRLSLPAHMYNPGLS